MMYVLSDQSSPVQSSPVHSPCYRPFLSTNSASVAPPLALDDDDDDGCSLLFLISADEDDATDADVTDG